MTLYLKYRPKDFESLVGQDFIKNTLRQAIVKDKLVGAYLFCGPRGTGKTSTARIFAKAINCLNLQDGNPCNTCEICTSCNDESLVDIIEIDAASYTGVDNIRDIIERASFSPTHSKYKVYIIDEVHMLSKGAFNALLKILEEPPAHLKFILATTESHKVPETILSRCQRYDFKSITSEDLKQRLLYIAQVENISIDEESLAFIVKQANGGLRNAISLFEQLIYNDTISFENVIKNYGIPKAQVISDFYQKLLHKDASLLDEYEQIISSYNLNLFFKELLFYIKDELISHISDEKLTHANIFILETLEEVYLKSKNSFDAKTTFLVGVIKCVKNIQTPPAHTSLPPQSRGIEGEFKKTEPKIEPKVEPKIEEEISHDDLLDVFGNDDFGFVGDVVETSVEKVQVQPSTQVVGNTNFDLEKFITGLKSLGAKGALTMSLRGSTLQFDGKNLVIYTKTKISLKQIATSDNTSLMIQALENMGLLNINIEVK